VCVIFHVGYTLSMAFNLAMSMLCSMGSLYAIWRSLYELRSPERATLSMMCMYGEGNYPSMYLHSCGMY